MNSINHFLELIAKEIKMLLGIVCNERMHLDDQVHTATCINVRVHVPGAQLSVYLMSQYAGREGGEGREGGME